MTFQQTYGKLAFQGTFTNPSTVHPFHFLSFIYSDSKAIQEAKLIVLQVHQQIHQWEPSN